GVPPEAREAAAAGNAGRPAARAATSRFSAGGLRRRPGCAGAGAADAVSASERVPPRRAGHDVRLRETMSVQGGPRMCWHALGITKCVLRWVRSDGVESGEWGI